MHYLQITFLILLALEFLYIMYLETFAPQSKQTARVFKLSPQVLQQQEVQTLFKNQGVYNGLLAIAIIVALILGHTLVLNYIVAYIIAVAIYGSFTVNKHIWWKQGIFAWAYVAVTIYLHF
ncbi:DUF1304 domain-containing protein [Psittacicella gerlachiana]|uniref:DUF1304 domain-containing protein n=1 Tax=Psittacicella gerlachiana TaxID=2028574 RepID=A0A3A1YDS2_9GAMM|nr:DUF1304 domain-containing protein [Psittacicella gerlachiana]RIY35566.1 hypothetical protein CKF59_03520 [Psittacicella gerlachiana]